MKIKKSAGDYIFDSLNIIFMVFLMIITLYPLLHILFASVSSPLEVMRHTGFFLWPRGFTLSSYKLVFENSSTLSGFKNTLIYMVSGTAVNILFTSLGAYVLSRQDFYFKNAVMFMIVFTMFFNGGMIPTYLTVNNLGLRDTLWAMILPNAISTMNLIILRTSFKEIPASLEESALIDGANDIQILFRVIIPLSLPVLAVMVLFYGVGHWNSWFNAMLYLRTRSKFPLQLLIREILITNSMNQMLSYSQADNEPVEETLKFATIMVATIPVLCVYPFLQKYFVKGVMVGAIKG